MRKILSIGAIAALLFVLGANSAQAANTGTYDSSTGIVTITNTGGEGASYERTSDAPAANGDILSFEYRSTDVACGGGAPRVFIQSGAYNTFNGNANQCGADGDSDGWYTVTGTVSGITDGTAGLIGLVNDNPSDLGTIEFRNVTLDGASLLPATAAAPQNKEQCKDGGWQNGSYRNQGECVSSFARQK